MVSNKHNYKKLVLSGGGVKGICHIGALYALDELEILDKIEIFAGTSIGSLVIALYVVGYIPSELYNFIISFDFGQMKNVSIFNMKHFGFDRCDKMEYVIYRLIIQKNIDPYITLAELYKITRKEVIFTTVCVNTKELCYISHETNPDIPLLTAVRMSMAIPILFTPVNYNGYLYIDGGCYDNYPISLFKNDTDVLGILIVNCKDVVDTIDNLEVYLTNILWCIIHGKHHSQKLYYDTTNTIKVDINSISSVDYSLPIDKKDELFLKGYNSTLDKFKN